MWYGLTHDTPGVWACVYEDNPIDCSFEVGKETSSTHQKDVPLNGVFVYIATFTHDAEAEDGV